MNPTKATRHAMFDLLDSIAVQMFFAKTDRERRQLRSVQRSLRRYPVTASRRDDYPVSLMMPFLADLDQLSGSIRALARR